MNDVRKKFGNGQFLTESSKRVFHENDISASNGLAVPSFATSYAFMFVLWARIAAISYQDKGLQIH